MAEESQEGNDLRNLFLRLPLFSCIIREHLWLKKFTISKSFLKKAIENPELFTDFSVLKSIKTDDNVSNNRDYTMTQIKGKTHGITDKQLKLYDDFQWSRVPDYYWPIHGGDYSPLSPDGEFLERHGKIGLDFWRWHRETSPLGYVPPLCTCKRTEDCIKFLNKWSRNLSLEFEQRVCENDVCKGLLYIPHSLLEIPLNRVISNCSEFALKVKVPNSTDLYCGNMKHTIILCTTSKTHEEECLQAIELSDVSTPLIYDINKDDFIPFFKKYEEGEIESPLMTVEPIDSDVSDTEENYGLGQLFAIKRVEGGLLIEKYDPNLRSTSPIDVSLLETWNRMCNKGSRDQLEKSHPIPTKTIKSSESDSTPTGDGLPSNMKLDSDSGPETTPPNESREFNLNNVNTIKDNDCNHYIDNELTKDNNEEYLKDENSDNPMVDISLNGEEYLLDEVDIKLEGTLGDSKSKESIDYTTDIELGRKLTQKRSLEMKDYKIYELIESFSSDRRPLNFTLRNGSDRTKSDKNHVDKNKIRKIIKINQKTLESALLLNSISKF